MTGMPKETKKKISDALIDYYKTPEGKAHKKKIAEGSKRYHRRIKMLLEQV